MADCRAADEFERLHDQGKFLSLAMRFVVTEVIICRCLLRDYVYIFYKVFASKTGRPVAEVEGNFERRVKKYRAEADVTLDKLTEVSVGRLHEMADDEGMLND